MRRCLNRRRRGQPQQPPPPGHLGGLANHGEVYAQFVAGELEHERKRRERLDARATATIAASAALVGLAVAIGIFNPASLSKQPSALGGVFLLGALLILVSAVLALVAAWLHEYDVLDRGAGAPARHGPRLGRHSSGRAQQGRPVQRQHLDTLRKGNNKKSKKFWISHWFQLAGMVLILAVAFAATVRSVV